MALLCDVHEESILLEGAGQIQEFAEAQPTVHNRVVASDMPREMNAGLRRV